MQFEKKVDAAIVVQEAMDKIKDILEVDDLTGILVINNGKEAKYIWTGCGLAQAHDILKSVRQSMIASILEDK